MEADVSRFQNSMVMRGLTPFNGDDTSVGMEYELQVAMEGDHKNVDLAATVQTSSYYKILPNAQHEGIYHQAAWSHSKSFFIKTSPMSGKSAGSGFLNTD
ncbi:MAG: hypothetical protein WBB19_15180 [Desulforhopalus sp.]